MAETGSIRVVVPIQSPSPSDPAGPRRTPLLSSLASPAATGKRGGGPASRTARRTGDVMLFPSEIDSNAKGEEDSSRNSLRVWSIWLG